MEEVLMRFRRGKHMCPISKPFCFMYIITIPCRWYRQWTSTYPCSYWSSELFCAEYYGADFRSWHVDYGKRRELCTISFYFFSHHPHSFSLSLQHYPILYRTIPPDSMIDTTTNKVTISSIIILELWKVYLVSSDFNC